MFVLNSFMCVFIYIGRWLCSLTLDYFVILYRDIDFVFFLACFDYLVSVVNNKFDFSFKVGVGFFL